VFFLNILLEFNAEVDLSINYFW